MHFNRSSKKYIGLFDQGQEERVLIHSLDELYEYSERLRETARRYIAE